MKANSNWLAIILALSLSACAVQATEAVQTSNPETQNNEEKDPGTDEIAIYFKKSGTSDKKDPALTKGPMLQSIAARHGLIITFSHIATHGQQMWKLDRKIPHPEAEKLSKEIKASSRLIEHAEPNYHLLRLDPLKSVNIPN
ncbi:hypothetical protein FNU76_15820 [Chitinimonas arctica]|uniref:Uncharacterized protein n=1 Tax=Chitinimonas arctica TaxID=2594795 RepID=A0A516SHR7_9NEIS|nr:hypothetical protein [Chitinimonas arctica]QDQ27699.1 hypothetical protein FNU76_15820 [Chitinimonas arctica]